MHVSRLASLLLAAALAFASAAAQEPPPAEEPPEASQDRPPAEDPPEAPEGDAAERAGNDAQAPGASGAEPTETSEAGAGDTPDGAAAADAAEDAEEPPYMVECGPDPETGARVCQVDRDTYVGWRTFHAVCHTCHAQDAIGSTFAPALLPRIQNIDKARFVQVVDQGFTGQVGVMPAWGMNPNVNRYYDELWAYLRARADGVLLPGRPKRLPD